jgi:hypothetical protein
MRLTNEMKEILAYSLGLHVEEMAEGRNKQLAIYMLGTWQQQGIWGRGDDMDESFFPDNDEY